MCVKFQHCFVRYDCLSPAEMFLGQGNKCRSRPKPLRCRLGGQAQEFHEKCGVETGLGDTSQVLQLRVEDLALAGDQSCLQPISHKDLLHTDRGWGGGGMKAPWTQEGIQGQVIWVNK